LAFLLGLLSVTMVMGKTAELAEMAKLPEKAEDSRHQTAAAERMEMDAMEKRQLGESSKCDANWISNSESTCKMYEDNNWCTKDGSYGTGWIDSFGIFDKWAVDGRSALVCPQCGCKDSCASDACKKYPKNACANGVAYGCKTDVWVRTRKRSICWASCTTSQGNIGTVELLVPSNGTIWDLRSWHEVDCDPTKTGELLHLQCVGRADLRLRENSGKHSWNECK